MYISRLKKVNLFENDFSEDIKVCICHTMWKLKVEKFFFSFQLTERFLVLVKKFPTTKAVQKIKLEVLFNYYFSLLTTLISFF